MFFFFKQSTAYELRIGDWSSDVCSSDLYKGLEGLIKARGITVVAGEGMLEAGPAVRVGDDLYRGADVILATGSYSRTLPGLEIGGRVLTSEHALDLAEKIGRAHV